MKSRASRTAVALRPALHDSMGSLRPILESRGYRTRYVPYSADRARAIDPLDIDILVVVGHLPMRADLGHFLLPHEVIDLIRVRAHYGLPLLGIDFGAQLIAHALGGEIHALARPEIGIAPVQLTEAGRRSCLAPLGRATPVVHWHGHEIALPPGFQCLASTSDCHVQAFRHGQATLGLQFHLEADHDYLHARLQTLHTALTVAGLDANLFPTQATEGLQRMRHACHAVMTRWLDELDGQEDPDTAPAELWD
jgi:GMP synthase (glutamine-hydrolysing)